MTAPMQSRITLSAEEVELAYRVGLFPMADPVTSVISWYAPDPRTVIALDAVQVPRSLRSVIRRKIFDVRWDTAFGDVMRGCAERDETWISASIITAYEELHRRGAAHSVECWQHQELVGGLYGVALGGAFFGESMFSRRTDASKVALIALVERMKDRGMTLLDTQFLTAHLARFGAVEIPRSEYLERLNAALRLKCSINP